MGQANCADTSTVGPPDFPLQTLLISTAAAKMGLLTLALEKGESYSSVVKLSYSLTWRALLQEQCRNIFFLGGNVYPPRVLKQKSVLPSYFKLEILYRIWL